MTDPDAVRLALMEFDALGRDEFLRRYGFRPSRGYFTEFDGKRYDSKAIVGAAYGHQYADRGPLRPHGFSGGDATVRVRSYADVIAEYRTHPEAKSAGPDGRLCGRETHGLLWRRPIGALSVVGIGKEANRLAEVEAGLVDAWNGVRALYRHPDREPWRTVVLPVLRLLPAAKVAGASGLTTRAVRSARNGHAVPHPLHRDALTRAAADLARDALRGCGLPAPADSAAACVAFLRAHAGAAPMQRPCAVCGRPLDTSNSRALLLPDVSEACFPTHRGAHGQRVVLATNRRAANRQTYRW